jgi:hypothetical protein
MPRKPKDPSYYKKKHKRTSPDGEKEELRRILRTLLSTAMDHGGPVALSHWLTRRVIAALED